MASLQMGVDNLGGNQTSNKRLSMSMLGGGDNKAEINKITAEHTRDILGKYRHAAAQDRSGGANLESSPYLDDKLTREIRKRTGGV